MKLERQNFFLLRTPLLPLHDLEAFNQLIKQPESSVIESLVDIFNNPCLKEAVFIASPELYQEFEKFLIKGRCSDKEMDKLQSTLLKYLIRSCARATPYGLFAGCTVGWPAITTNIELEEMEKHVRFRRLDTNYLSELVAALLRNPLIADNTKYFINSSLYKASDKYRYAEYNVNNGTRRYNLVAVDRSPYLDAIVNYAETGAYKIELVQILEKKGIDQAEAVDFIDNLVKEQILVNELEPTVTGENFMDVLIRQLKSIEGAEYIIDQLTKINELLQQQDTSIEKYRHIKQILHLFGVSAESKDLIQTDLFLSTKSRHLNERVLNGIVADVEKISQLAGMYISKDLEAFKQLFVERYEEQEIPLAIALDSEMGIGYGNNKDVYSTVAPLADAIVTDGQNASGFDVRVNAYDKWQLDLYLRALRTGTTEVVLSEDDITRLSKPNLPFLPGAYIFGSLHAKNAAAIDAGDYSFYLKNFSGSSLANLLGRFCAGNQELAALTVQAVQQTEADQEDVVYAEIVHLPQSRLGNILARPSMRNYEIVYLGNSYINTEKKAGINDLYVSVRNNEVLLYSRKLGKKVIPRLTTAHNYSFNSLPVYQFLCDLQFQHTRSGYSWTWTNALNGQPYFPRVRYRTLLLSRSSWKISLADCDITSADLKAGDVQLNKLKNRISFLASTFHMPLKVTIVEGDNELPVDLSLPSHVVLLQKVLLKRGAIYLLENLHEPDNCFILQGARKFTNEIIIPVSVRSAPEVEQVRNTPLNAGKAKRIFTPGSEWQYFKVYCGTNTGERILREVVQPLVGCLRKNNMLDKWFFVRYADPQYHLRIRFRHKEDAAFLDTIHKNLNDLVQPFIKDRLIYKIQTDTYSRELERYGVETIDMAEDVFCCESDYTLTLLTCFQTDESERERWLWALKSIDALFDATNIHLPDRFKLVNRVGENFVAEFGGANLKDQLNALYHKEQKTVEYWLSKAAWPDGPEHLYEEYRTRNERLEKIFCLIHDRSANNNGTYSLTDLLPSFIHMFINRVFNAKQRKYEMVLYYFLIRFYKSQIARGNRCV